MSRLYLPTLLFRTQKWIDDYSANDMRCGELSEAQLRKSFMLNYVSDAVDPYTLTRRSAFDRPQSIFCCNNRTISDKISVEQCAEILFYEFRQCAHAFSLYGPYRHLIIKMINHMQYGKGTPFSDTALDAALKEQLLNDRTANSSLLRIKGALSECINWRESSFPVEKIEELTKAIQKSKLPKFDHFQDNFNGMGITVHDTWATQISLLSLHIAENRYRATLSFHVQDHFGLDSTDISQQKFNQFMLFRIWFVLQHYSKFAFKPFMTNISTTIEIAGSHQ